MANSATVGAWSFHPFTTSFPQSILPNIAYWNVTNGTWEYQVHIFWPLNWTSNDATSTVDTLYVLDGNALAHTATEAFRKRRPVDSTQPDTIVVSIGYPNLIPDSPYSETRYYDYQIPVCANSFVDEVLRPWMRNTFPYVEFNRDGLYGNSFSGLFVLYTLLVRPELFDVYLCASPALYWNDDYIFSQLGPLKHGSPNGTRKPALQISYGGYEQFPKNRRTETIEAYKERRALLNPMRMTDLCNQLYDELKGSPSQRHIELHEYPFSYHAAVGSEALCDWIDYFLDW